MTELFEYEFMRNALAVGTLVALLAGAAGYFVVLRGQAFAAHMLSQVGFPGAAWAVLVGAPPVAGLAVFSLAAALGLAAGGRRLEAGRRTESATVGALLAFALGLGLAFFQLFHGSSPQAIYGFLFGGVLGISRADVLLTLVTAVACLGALAVIGRPLFFASIDLQSAEARGVPTSAVSLAFLLVLALSAAVAVQVAGTLLVFALLVTPAAAAAQLSARPAVALPVTIGLALACTWAGLAAAFYTGYPAGFLVTTVAFATYGAARLSRAL